MKRNSSKTKRKTAGFTLVEMVVVIAVLAILAGVGAVAYNGYIEYAKKGQDRATVGEIMHAVELADYANPELFGENSGAMIVLTTDGVKVAGGLEGSDLKGALEDAFGDIDSAKLNYDKWDGTADMSVFEDLGGTGTQIAAYLEATGDDGAASFAGDIDELWQAVQDTLGAISEQASEEAQVYMDRVVNFSTKKDKVTVAGKTYENGNVEYILDKWKNGEDIKNPSGSGADYLGPCHSRNYAFYMYAKNHCADWDDAMKKEMDELLNLRGSLNYFTSDASQYPLHDSRWKELIESYITAPEDGKSQAEIDALAYLGMMEAAKAVGDNNRDPKTGKVSDSVYLSAFEGYVGMVGNVLSKKVNLDTIKELAKDATGNVIIVNATKKNGTMVFSVSPEEANPREEAEEETITYNTEIAFDDMPDGLKGTLVLSSTDDTFKTGTVTVPFALDGPKVTADPEGIVNFSYSGKTVTVTAVGKGNAVVKIVGSTGRFTYNWTVNVVVH